MGRMKKTCHWFMGKQNLGQSIIPRRILLKNFQNLRIQVVWKEFPG